MTTVLVMLVPGSGLLRSLTMFSLFTQREPCLALAQKHSTGLRAYLKQGSDLSVIPL